MRLLYDWDIGIYGDWYIASIEDCDNAKCVPLYDHPYSDLYIFFGYLYSGLDELGMDKTLPIYETLRNLSLSKYNLDYFTLLA